MKPQQDPFDSVRHTGPNLQGLGGTLLPDSGARTEFATGAVRDAQPGKGEYSDIPACAEEALAKRFEDGGQKYVRGNWMKGIPLSNYYNSLRRHAAKAKLGHTDEDHFGAMLWNVSCWMWTEQEIAAGRLPKELDDLPFRRRAEASLEACAPDALQQLLRSQTMGSLSGGPTEKETPL